MKKIISFLLTLSLVSGLCGALAINPGEERVVIGADLSESQISDVYESFGIGRGSVTELKVTNAEEREYLGGYVGEDIIGTRSISCVYIKTLDEGSGLDVTTHNISWCSEAAYTSALVTAGITDARVIVSAPFEVSGTAALTGIYKAYEDVSGDSLDETAKEVGTQELVVTSELAEQIGSVNVNLIVNDIKLILDETKEMSDEELGSEIEGIALRYDISLNSDQTGQLVSLCRSFEKLNIDELKNMAESVQNTIKKLAETGDKLRDASSGFSKFWEGVKNFFSSIGRFFSNLFG